MPRLYCRDGLCLASAVIALLILTPAQVLSQPPSSPRWTNHASGDTYSAEISAGDRTISVMCNRGGRVLLGLAGFGGRTGAVTLTIDGRAYRSPAVTRNDVHFTQVDPVILRALMGGNRLQAFAGSSGNRFSLSGSGAAISAALAACGLVLR